MGADVGLFSADIILLGYIFLLLFIYCVYKFFSLFLLPVDRQAKREQKGLNHSGTPVELSVDGMWN
jgi:hypothetical protein